MIEIKKISKRFGKLVVLDEIDLVVPDRKITVIIGRSGVGKSVLLKHILGLLKPDSGEIYVDGEEITSMDDLGMKNVLSKFGVLFQSAALFDSMNVYDNIAFPMVEHTNMTKDEIEKKVAENLKLVGMSGVEEKAPSELSGGMRKRVGLARAIALNPETVLFDEPTTGLDPLMKDTIHDLISDTHKRLGITYLVISHDLEGAFEIAHKIAMLHDGKIIEEGTPDEIRASKNPVVVQFLTRSKDGPIKVI